MLTKLSLKNRFPILKRFFKPEIYPDIAVFNIPQNYFEIISKTRSYLPPPEERKLLEDKSVTRHSLGFVKNDQVFKVA